MLLEVIIDSCYNYVVLKHIRVCSRNSSSFDFDSCLLTSSAYTSIGQTRKICDVFYTFWACIVFSVWQIQLNTNTKTIQKTIHPHRSLLFNNKLQVNTSHCSHSSNSWLQWFCHLSVHYGWWCQWPGNDGWLSHSTTTKIKPATGDCGTRVMCWQKNTLSVLMQVR